MKAPNVCAKILAGEYSLLDPLPFDLPSLSSSIPIKKTGVNRSHPWVLAEGPPMPKLVRLFVGKQQLTIVDITPICFYLKKLSSSFSTPCGHGYLDYQSDLCFLAIQFDMGMDTLIMTVICVSQPSNWIWIYFSTSYGYGYVDYESDMCFLAIQLDMDTFFNTIWIWIYLRHRVVCDYVCLHMNFVV